MQIGHTCWVYTATMLLAWSGASLYADSTLAQNSHIQQLQDIAGECLATSPGEFESFVLDSDSAAPYVRQYLFSRWQEEDRKMYLADSLGSMPRLKYRVLEAKIELYRAGKNRIGRTTRLSLSIQLTGPDGELLSDRLCGDVRTDTLSTDTAHMMIDSRYPETNVSPPAGGWFRRYLQPAVIVGASAIGTYLFFNLRSRRTGSG